MRLTRLLGRAGPLCLALVAAASCDSGTDPSSVFTHPAGDDVVFLALDGRPHGVATSSDGMFAISQIDAGSVSFGVIDEAFQAFAGAATVGSAPAHVAINRAGTRAYTTNQFSSSVSVVDVPSAEEVTTIPLNGDGFNLLVTPSGQRVYATTGNGWLHVINTATNESIEEIFVGEAANGLAYHEKSRTLYVSSRDAATITAIDGDDNTIIRTYDVSGMPQRIAVSADNTELYIASEVVGLEILTLASGDVTTVDEVSSAAVGLAQSPDGAEIWLTHPPLGLVTVVDRVSRTVKRADEIGSSPRNVAFDATGATAIIADEGNRVYFVR